MPFNIGFGELLLVLIVALLVFGGRLPEVGRSLGKGLMEFKRGLQGVKDLADDTLGDEEEGEEDATEPEDGDSGKVEGEGSG
jgi:sec-independent protein translocase protein TatA